MRTLITLCLTAIGFTLYAQPCEVRLPDLQGTYEGGCKDGKADGFGSAKGKHRYDGLFKKGKPEGRGTYTWEDGHYYVGEWKDGMKDGEGELHYAGLSGSDSVVAGKWKKDKMIVSFNEPYIIHFQTQKITRLKVDSTEANDNSIVVEVENNTGGTGSIMSGMSAKMEVNDIQMLKGQYDQLINSSNSAKKTVTRIMSPTFPFRCKLVMGSEMVDIEFTRKVNWRVQVFINQ